MNSKSVYSHSKLSGFQCQKTAPTALKRKGISLLEVIIATAILAISSIMLVQIIGTADRNAKRADRRIMGQMICQNKLDEILATFVPPQSSDNQPDLYYPDWQVVVNVEPWKPDSLEINNDLVLVEIQAFFRPVEEFTETNSTPDDSENPAYFLRRILRRPNPENESLSSGGLLGDFK